MDGSFSHDLRGPMAVVPDALSVAQGDRFSPSAHLPSPARLGAFQPRPLVTMALPAIAAVPLESGAFPAPAAQTPPDPAQEFTPTPPALPDRTAARADLIDQPSLRAQIRAEVLAELAQDRAALASTAQSLARALQAVVTPPAAQIASLTAQLHQAVGQLASTLAGQAIDTQAAPFARRIAQLAMRVTAQTGDLTVQLHPDDCAAVAAVLAQSCPDDLASLAKARLQPDVSLARGDIRLRAGGLRLDDLKASAAIKGQTHE
jgi:hypothetical protein